MSANIVKFEESNQSVQQRNDLPEFDPRNLEQFIKMMNTEPEPHEIDINKAAGNTKYIPISFLQMKLDKFFLGLWSEESFRYSVVVNEICGVLTLRFYHPASKTWITREGAAAVMIQQRSEKNGGNGDITDVGQKIKNTLQKDLPHLKASCFANACKSIGKNFGRDLNRKDDLTDYYTTFYSDIADAEAASDAIDWDKVKTTADLSAIWKQHEHLHNNQEFKKKFTYRKNQIKK